MDPLEQFKQAIAGEVEKLKQAGKNPGEIAKWVREQTGAFAKTLSDHISQGMESIHADYPDQQAPAGRPRAIIDQDEPEMPGDTDNETLESEPPFESLTPDQQATQKQWMRAKAQELHPGDRGMMDTINGMGGPRMDEEQQAPQSTNPGRDKWMREAEEEARANGVQPGTPKWSERMETARQAYEESNESAYASAPTPEDEDNMSPDQWFKYNYGDPREERRNASRLQIDEELGFLDKKAREEGGVWQQRRDYYAKAMGRSASKAPKRSMMGAPSHY